MTEQSALPVPKVAPAKPVVDPDNRAQFDSNMVMVKHLNGKADQPTAEYFYRELVEQCRFLARRHGFRFG